MTMMRTRLGKTMFALLLAGLCALASPSYAADDAGAKALFAEGRELFNNGNFDEASAKFKAAYDLKPNFKLLYNIAQSEVAAKRYEQALEIFERYLADGGDELVRERQEEVSAEIERIKGMLGFVEIETARGAEIQIDGVVRGTAPVHGGIPVVAGKMHTVEVWLNGKALPSEQVKVTSGKTVTISILPATSIATTGPVSVAETQGGEPVTSDEPEVAVSKASDSEDDRSLDRSSKRLKVAGLVMVGVAVATLGVGVVTGALVLGIEKDLDKECTGGFCPPSKENDMDTQRHLAVSSTVMFAVGGASAATALVLLLVSKKRSERISAVPAIGPGAAGAVVSVRF